MNAFDEAEELTDIDIVSFRQVIAVVGVQMTLATCGEIYIENV